MFDRRVSVWLLAGMLVLGCSALPAVADGQKKDGVKPPARRSGRVVGEVTARDRNWVEVKADGEEKARRYFPRWVGGAPRDGGGFDKKMLETIAKLKVGSRVRLEWQFEERPRVVKVEVLRQPAEKR